VAREVESRLDGGADLPALLDGAVRVGCAPRHFPAEEEVFALPRCRDTGLRYPCRLGERLPSILGSPKLTLVGTSFAYDKNDGHGSLV
jgi:hypothetical protein